MKISSVNVESYTTGRMMVLLDNNDSVHLQLTEDESERFRQLAAEIFFSRQKSIAREIENAAPALLADFTEVETVSDTPKQRADFVDDDDPF